MPNPVKRKASKEKEPPGNDMKSTKKKMPAANKKQKKSGHSKNQKDDGGQGGGGKKAGRKQPPELGKKKQKSRQLSIFGAGIEKIPQEPLYIGKTVVLTTVIHDRNVPPDHVGMLFLYKVTSYDIDKKSFH